LLLEAGTPEWRGIIGTEPYAGLRKGEIFGLQKSDLDFRERTIAVARSYGRDTAKIPMADSLAFILRDAVAASTAKHVFPNEDGGIRSPRSGAEKPRRSSHAVQFTLVGVLPSRATGP